eukprot:15469554-Alexandrium_andersonii.AAC.1
MNTEEIGGIPQHRERIYIVGIQKALLPSNDKDTFQFIWPDAIPTPTLSKFLSPNRQAKWVPTAEGYLTRMVSVLEKIFQE